ncbi:hypothetical protein [Hymenobacter cellulosilyticus]|uniref:Uncharacterized protein n=1 Tax=Hymenobacter cellulosilyticus TaxID=2932248 RepID=A0A8T9Q5W1_9BACT|nr:hypothetical protein [Hymenobacter cellulosilyticus]UOQ71160.1 hypothetical protein MUN79_21245 [Hymenobacter cellulosilyticus]
MFTPDPHSYARPAQVQVRHLLLDLEVNFSTRTLRGMATWQLTNHTGATELWLDARTLTIEAVRLDGPDGPVTDFELGPATPCLVSRSA